MMEFSFNEIYSYVSIVILLVMIPGPNTVLVMQSVSTNGRRFGFFNVAGIVTAVYLNALLSGLGLSVIVMQSTEIYQIMKIIGAVYIGYLGVTSLIGAYQLHKQEAVLFSLHDHKEEQNFLQTRESGFSFYSKGVLTGVLNPKSALFFLAFFPQFMHQEGNIAVQSLILTVLYSLVSVTWYSLMVLFIGKLRQFVVRRQTQKWLKTITGSILIGMGIKIGLQR